MGRSPLRLPLAVVLTVALPLVALSLVVLSLVALSLVALPGLPPAASACALAPAGSLPAGSLPAGLASVPAGPWPAAPDPAAPVPPYRWPLDGAVRVARAFDPPPRPWLAGHRGVDLAAVPGATVRSAGTGVIRYAGRIAGRGVLSVTHGGGLRTTYEPVDALPGIEVGGAVVAGQPLGVLAAGHPGCAAPACLHWGLRGPAGEYLDPLALLGLGRVRLLPLRPPAASADRAPGQPARSAVLASSFGSSSASRSYSSARL
jgi:murein DD-endopeptidase MepM/ murein hydrolase activator NlpD